MKFDLDAGLLLELREVGLQVLMVGALKSRTRDADPSKFLGLSENGRRPEAHGCARNTCERRAQQITAMDPSS